MALSTLSSPPRPALTAVLGALRRRDTLQPQRDGTYLARCPRVHPGPASLTVRGEGDGSARLRCARGCTETAILRALGLDAQDVPRPSQAEPAAPAETSRTVGSPSRQQEAPRARVQRDQRFYRDFRCLICGGASDDRHRGQGLHCWGFISSDDTRIFCTNDDADHGQLEPVTVNNCDTWVHRLDGPCACGETDHRLHPANPAAAASPTSGADGSGGKRRESPAGHQRIVAVYRYWDEDGQLLFEEVRYGPVKGFTLRRLPRESDPPEAQAADAWVYNMVGVRRVPYNLPALVTADPKEPVYVVEGPGKVDVLSAHGLLATCNSEGAGKWSDGHSRYLTGRRVVVIPDDDQAGRKHAQQVAESLRRFDCDVLRLHPLPDVGEGGDIKDYLAQEGRTIDDLLALVEAVYAARSSAGRNQQQGTSTGKRAATDEDEAATAVPWPKPLTDVAYHGVLGGIAREIEPYIEADSAALLTNLIVAAGAGMGRGPHLEVAAGQHANHDAVVVGATGQNKTDSWWPIAKILARMTAKAEQDGLPLAPPQSGGCSTGEGLLNQVRDVRTEHRKTKDGEWEVVEVDPGVEDKRLLVVEGEFSRLLTAMGRQDNTLSQVIRELHDGQEQVRSSPKVGAVVATGAHVAIIGMITPRELAAKLRAGELSNGFANRIAWPLTHRIKSLPHPPAYSGEVVERHAEMLSKAIAAARAVTVVTLDDEAQAMWEAIYEHLREGDETRQGAAEEVAARAHTHVLRIALTFTALDGSSLITASVLEAALAVWTYLEACAVYLFGTVSGSPIAETIAAALAERGRLSRTEISHLFGGHVTKVEIDAALESLKTAGRARSWKEKTAGPSREWWEGAQA